MASHFAPFLGTGDAFMVMAKKKPKTNGAADLFGRPRVPHYLVTPPSHHRHNYIRRGGSEDGTGVPFAQRRRPAKTKQEMNTGAKAGPAWGRAHSSGLPAQKRCRQGQRGEAARGAAALPLSPGSTGK